DAGDGRRRAAAARGLLLEPVGARPGRVRRGPGSHPGDAGAIARGARTGARPHLRGGRADPGSPRRGDQPGLARVAGPPARAAGLGGVAGGAVARTGCGLTAPRPRNIRAEGRDFPWRPSEFRGLEELLRKYDRPGPRYTSYQSEEHTSELQSRENLVCRLLLEKKNE